MKNAILKAVAFTIAIGILAMAFNTAFGYQTIVYLQKEQVNILDSHFYIWKIDFWSYFKNIQLTTSNISILEFNIPNLAFNSDVVHNLSVVANILILQINILLYPLKIGAYLIQNVMAIFGINTDLNATYNGLKWLVYFVNNILANISIPYINA